MGHLFLSPSGRVPSRWRQAFPGGTALALDEVDPAALEGATVIWVCAPANRLPALIARLTGLRPGLPVVALDLEPAQETAAAVLQAGARGYCHALATAPLLAQVAIVVAHGGLWLGPELVSRMVAATRRHLPATAPPEPGLDGLTARERAVAEEVARGATNKEAARRLGITERTVKAHLGAVFAKLGVRDRLHLALSLQPRAGAEAQPAWA